MERVEADRFRGLVWSLGPVMSWMRRLGIELDGANMRPDYRKQFFWRYVARQCSLISFLALTSLVCCRQVTKELQFTGYSEYAYSRNRFNTIAVKKVVYFIGLFNMVAFYFITHVAMVIVAGTNWSRLFATMQHIERNSPIKIVVRCRKIAITATVCISLVNINRFDQCKSFRFELNVRYPVRFYSSYKKVYWF